jgi:hypothetical protein
LRVPLVLALALAGCGPGAGANNASSGDGWRLVATPGEPGHLHLAAHLEGLVAAEGMVFARGGLVVRDRDGAAVLVQDEALSLYAPALEGGVADPQLEATLPAGLPPGRYLVELAVSDGIGGRVFPMQTAVDLPWAAPVVPPGFGLQPAGGKSAGPAAAAAGEEITLAFQVYGYRTDPSARAKRVAIDSEVSLERAGATAAAPASAKSATRSYRAEAPWFPPLLDLVYRVSLPAALAPGDYTVRVALTDQLGGGRAEVVHPLKVEAARTAMGPPVWDTTIRDAIGAVAHARLPMGAGPPGVGLDVSARVVGTDGTVVAALAAPVHFDTDRAPRELAVTIALPAGVPDVPLHLEAAAAPPGLGDAGVLARSWLLPPASAPPAPTPAAATRLEALLRAPDVAAGAAVGFDARLLAPPAPPIDEVKSPGLRGMEISFSAVLLDAKGAIVLKEVKADVAERVLFVPREVGVSGTILTPSTLVSGTYTLRITARDEHTGGVAWTVELRVPVRH